MSVAFGSFKNKAQISQLWFVQSHICRDRQRGPKCIRFFYFAKHHRYVGAQCSHKHTKWDGRGQMWTWENVRAGKFVMFPVLAQLLSVPSPQAACAPTQTTQSLETSSLQISRNHIALLLSGWCVTALDKRIQEQSCSSHINVHWLAAVVLSTDLLFK